MSGRVYKGGSKGVNSADRRKDIPAKGGPAASVGQDAVTGDQKELAEIVAAVPRMLWAAGPDGRFTHVNDEWVRFTGNPRARVLGSAWMERIDPKDTRIFQRLYSEAVEQKKRFSTVVRLRRHDGVYRSFVLQGLPRILEDGSFAGFAGCGLDVTEEIELSEIPLELSGRLIQAQEIERARIARELHDDICQRIALLTNGIQEIEKPQTHATAAQQKHQLHALRKLATEIGADVQFLSHQLHPSKLQYLGLTAAIRSMCREISARHKLDVACIVRDIPDKLSESVSLSLFRTAQESLQNVVKHSRARHATVELVGQSDVIRLRVSDDGIGFDASVRDMAHGLGLVSMRERLNSVGGDLSVSSRRKAGTQIVGVVPVHPQRRTNSTRKQ